MSLCVCLNVCVCACACVCVYKYVCACVCGREKEYMSVFLFSLAKVVLDSVMSVILYCFMCVHSFVLFVNSVWEQLFSACPVVKFVAVEMYSAC